MLFTIFQYFVCYGFIAVISASFITMICVAIFVNNKDNEHTCPYVKTGRKKFD